MNYRIEITLGDFIADVRVSQKIQFSGDFERIARELAEMDCVKSARVFQDQTIPFFHCT